ncbi:Lipoprotein-anchoring transpeptidase ErfK/SrfK [Devosia lucknowensis]|uniref:Lipoprotein-anchoring transpeptidase ErfK/SrfK n=1 Tax=Devosia lucknowensis TaxID=1096929 RepID=A0A1Y6GCC9_9HYPH|nr:L,D-transpeptidase [Devosia lucknowensis]SMQ85729.1 Lipoprotein-anchoring transpeptidase ErfK/SrfK [Devosia lucknowensis]
MSSVIDATLSRRAVLAGFASLGALALAGCSTTGTQRPVIAEPIRPVVPPDVLAMYAARPEEDYPVPAADISQVDPKFWRQEVENTTGQPAGRVVVDTGNYVLYFTMPEGRAMRYGVGLGRAGFEWSGEGHIAYKRKWPVWTPPSEMIERQPELEMYRHGQPPGLLNALGARALYIHQGNRDTLYRIHGTMDVATIGKAVSSGCVRLLFHDVIDLYERVPSGAPIVVL